MSINRKEQIDYTQLYQIRSGRLTFADYVQRRQLIQDGRLLGLNLFPPDNDQSIVSIIKEGEVNTTPEELERYLAAVRSQEPQTIVTPSGPVPDPPTNLLGTSGDGQVTISFTPGSDNGSPITNYEYRTDPSGNYIPFSPATGAVSSVTISGLTNGTTYSIQLKAMNANGSSIETSEFLITPVPGGSALLLILDGANGGSTTVWKDTSGKLNNCTLTGAPSYVASNGGYYSFNGTTQFGEVPDGFSDFSAGLTILAFVNFGVSESWERLIDFGNGQQNNNILITRSSTSNNLIFRIYNGVNQSISFSDTLSNGIRNNEWIFIAARLSGSQYLLKNQYTTDTGSSSVLPNNITRTFNYIGKSNWATDSLFKGTMGLVAIYNSGLSDTQINNFFDLYKNRYFTVPGAPTSVSGTAGNAQVSVSFIAPVNTGGVPIISYTVTSSPGGFTATGSASPLIVTGLTNWTAYTFTVIATNTIGNSVASVASSAVTPIPPPPSGTYYNAPSTTIGVTTVVQSPFSGGGNSYNFNATPNYLTVVGNDSWALGTGDFTIEWFQYQTDSNPVPRIFSVASYPNASIACSLEGSFYAWFSSAQSFGLISPYKGMWVHFAIVRQSNLLKVYKNGVMISTALPNTTNITNNSTPLYFGLQDDQLAGTQFLGNLTNIRIVKGLAVYTGNFTVPTSALTQISSANPYGGSNTNAIPEGFTKLLLVP